MPHRPGDGRLATAPGSTPLLQLENPFSMREVWRPSIQEELLAGRPPEPGTRVFATVSTEAPPQQRRLREGVLQSVQTASCAEPFPDSDRDRHLSQAQHSLDTF